MSHYNMISHITFPLSWTTCLKGSRSFHSVFIFRCEARSEIAFIACLTVKSHACFYDIFLFCVAHYSVLKHCDERVGAPIEGATLYFKKHGAERRHCLLRSLRVILVQSHTGYCTRRLTEMSFLSYSLCRDEMIRRDLMGNERLTTEI